MRQSAVPHVKKRHHDQNSQDEDGEDASGIAHPLAHAEAEAGDQHHARDQEDGRTHEQSRARCDPRRIGPKGVCDVGGRDQRDL